MGKYHFCFRINGLMLLFFIWLAPWTLGQGTEPPKDSTLKLSSGYEKLSRTTKSLVARELRNSREEFSAHQVVLQQRKTFVLIKNEIEKTRSFLKQGFSYHEIKHEIDQLSEWKKLAGEGVIKSKGNFQTVRDLTTTSMLFKELLNRTDNRLRHITTYRKTLGQFQNTLDSLLMDSCLYEVPNDSVALIRYFQRLVLLNKDYNPVSVPLKIALDSIEKLEITVNQIKFSLEADIAETESLRQELLEKIGILEIGSFRSAGINDRSFSETLRFSAGKARLVLVFYVVNHFNTLVLMLIFIAGISLYLSMLKRRILVNPGHESLEDRQHVLAHPVASAILLVITIFQFFLPLPPFAVSGLLWIISGAALSVIMHKLIDRHWYRAWLLFFLLFLFGFADNLILRPSAMERWAILLASISGLAAGIYFLTATRKHAKGEKLILLFTGIMVFFELLAIMNFMTGGYNQLKTFMSSGFFTLMVAHLMYWTARLGNDTIQISYYFHKSTDEEFHHQPMVNLSGKIPVYLYLAFFAGCFVLITRNFYFYQTMFEPLDATINENRTIGAFTFTYKSVFIFILVLVLSAIISRVVSFLASDNSKTIGNMKSGGLGSWLLLIRIAIITLGVFLAFVSAGIPMDKFAIILGALSVGIGFGLQTLVNNLVSGLFIAFEKPVNVGDIVDIAGQTGKIKSIGIRSSIITTWDGADVIVPNGDLLNQHLVNWTLGNSRRRFDIIIGVAYGTDLEKTKTLLLELMAEDHRILKNPVPIVLATEFGSSSINLALKFWVPHFSIGFDVKSDLILAIDLLFKENGIQIPFPQQDVHIRSAAGLHEEGRE